jgi:hypothetical protein
VKSFLYTNSFHKAETRPIPTDQSENTEIPAPRPDKIDTEIIDQAIPAMLRLICDDLAFAF